MSARILKLVIGAGLLVAGAAAGPPAGAIVINDTAGDGSGPNGTVTLGAPFTGVVNILLNGSQECSGALISSTMVLTAQHCIRSTSTQNFFGTPGQFTVQVKSSGGSLLNSVAVSAFHETDFTSNLIDGSDVAILELASAVPGGNATPIRLLDAPTSTLVGQAVTMVGFGRHGVGSTGVTTNNADGTRRAATNIVDAYGAARGLGCTSAGGSNIINTDFDNNGSAGSDTLAGGVCGSTATTLAENPTEGTTAAGDSGGPLLYYDATLDEYLIAGVLSGGVTPFGNPSAYSDISQWTGTDAWQPFITSFGGVFVALEAAVPEPATLALFALALFGMTAYRRRRAFNR